MNEYYFINISAKDLPKLLEFCKLTESKYDANILTGLNFASLKDDSFLLGLVFKNKEEQDKCLKEAEEYEFEKIYTEEEKWFEIKELSEFCILGNFTYKICIGGKNGQRNEKIS